MNTAIGIVATEDGIAHDPSAPHQRAWSTRASALRSQQPASIPIDIEHSGRPVGQVAYLERDAHGRVWAVGELNAAPTVPVRVGDETVHVPTNRFYWSIERTPFDEDIIIRSVSLTRHPARVAATPLTWFDGGLSHRSGWHLPTGHIRGLVHRAGEASYHRHARSSLLIHDSRPAAAGLERNEHGTLFRDGQPASQLHHSRPYRSVLSVS